MTSVFGMSRLKHQTVVFLAFEMQPWKTTGSQRINMNYSGGQWGPDPEILGLKTWNPEVPNLKKI